MPAPGPYNSNSLPPIPQMNPPYGGNAERPTYFWNSSLSAEDVVCSVDYKNVTDSCCPYAFGIRDDYTTGCRMHNTTENTEWFDKCTRQIWGDVTGRPQDADPRCVSWTEKMQFTRDGELQSATPKAAKGDVQCTTLGTDPGINFTQNCCGQVGGSLAQEKDGRGNSLCTIKNDLEAKWNECIAALHTYPLCHGGEGDKGNGSGAPRLQEGNRVCYTSGAKWDDLVKPCCSPELGIYHDSAKACRLRNSDAVANYFTNCTQELVWDYIGNWSAKDWNATTAKTPEDVLGPYPLKPTCDTFISYRDRQLKGRSSSLESAMAGSRFKDVRGSMVCSGIGMSGHFNVTGQCCGQSGGIVKWAERGSNSSFRIPDGCYYPKNDSNSPAAVEEFKACMGQLQTWPVCANASQRWTQVSAAADSPTSQLRIMALVIAAAIAAIL